MRNQSPLNPSRADIAPARKRTRSSREHLYRHICCSLLTLISNCLCGNIGKHGLNRTACLSQNTSDKIALSDVFFLYKEWPKSSNKTAKITVQERPDPSDSTRPPATIFPRRSRRPTAAACPPLFRKRILRCRRISSSLADRARGYVEAGQLRQHPESLRV